MIDQIQWLGHGSFVIQGSPIICINPWRVARSDLQADVILVSHNHYDHCSLVDIDKLRGSDTKIIGNELVAKEVDNCIVLRPWQSVSIGRACIKAVPAYSLTESTHPASDGGLGFVISVNYYDIYYAGDTQIIPEMERIHPDIAILPIDGESTLTVSEAASAVKILKPRWAIPCNWGNIRGRTTRLDALRFMQEASSDTEVILLPEQ